MNTDGLISGRYRLGELLGTGGSASVFLALEVGAPDSVAVAVALKILHPHLSSSARSRDAFFAEARAASALRHPNVVAVLGVGVHSTGEAPLAWIALELAAGRTLAEHVEAHGPLTVGQGLTVATGVLKGLEAAHAVGLIHRDVTPANIMVAPDPRGVIGIAGVRLLDFGLADAAGRPALGTDVLRSVPLQGSDPAQHGVLGSVNYLSPEQARGDPVDRRGDIYQLGGVLHFAITGLPPFVRSSIAAVMRAHVQAPPPVPSVLNSAIPRQVDRLIVKALLKDPALRFQSATEMMTAVAEAMVSAASRPGEATVERTLVLGSVRPPAGRPAVPAVAQAFPSQAPPVSPGFRSPAGRSRGGLILLALLGGAGTVLWLLASGVPAPTSIDVTSIAPVATATGQSTPVPAETVDPAVTVRIPQLVSMTLAEARTALERAGLEVGLLTVQEDVHPGDTVLGSAPVGGSYLAVGQSVDLTVASGSNLVPSVQGVPEGDAQVMLQNAGFVVLTESTPDASTPPGAVVAIDPGAGTVLRLGSPVTITVATAPAAPATPVPSLAPTPTATPQPTESAAPPPLSP